MRWEDLRSPDRQGREDEQTNQKTTFSQLAQRALQFNEVKGTGLLGRKLAVTDLAEFIVRYRSGPRPNRNRSSR